MFETLARDLSFVLYEVLDIEALCTRPAFEGHARSDFDALLEAAIQLAKEQFAPCAAELDAQEPTFDNGRVVLPQVLSRVVQAYVEGGYLAAPFPETDGGLGLPYTIAQAMNSAFFAANPGASAYPLLTAAAANLLRAYGSDDQKAMYLEPMLEGRFFGTMVLSEPEAGSSLADLRTRAVPQDDGTFHIIGDKMWISAGEHELSENIVHLVLARIVDAPPGVGGISLFVVPRRHMQTDGSTGDLNGITLTGLNHKMGYRGTVNTALSFGADGPAVGTLVGKPHHGLRYMFHMMNEARTAVGLGATMIGYAGYRVSLAYARDRQQGRHPDERDPTTPPVPIVEHADVRRMLLMQKVYVEGGLGLGMYCAKLIDELETTTDEAARERIDDLLQILTPIAKAWPSEHGPRANDLAIQVLGGAGYTRDWPVERYYRDNRLNPIHEGTNGIQGLDLLGRKVTMHQGRAFRALLAEIQGSVARHRATPELEEICKALEAAIQTVTETTMALGAAAMQGQIRRFLANASEYLGMLGHVVVGWMWLEQAAAATAKLPQASEADRGFYEGKRHAAQFFIRYELPRIERAATLLRNLDDTALTMPDDGF
ncbi:MAG: acyl-CoA dehydrogenase [Myxococcota bacterium]